MSEPQIARRCRFCGASIRERAFFCPQCGKEIVNSEENATAEAENDSATSNDTALESAPPEALPSPQIEQDGESEVASEKAEIEATQTEAGTLPDIENKISDEEDEAVLPADDIEEQGRTTIPAGGVTVTDFYGEELTPTVATFPTAPRESASEDPAANDVTEADPVLPVQSARKPERLRQLSTTVLDEAAEDPSLRFVLIAALLFGGFLLLLLISELLT